MIISEPTIKILKNFQSISSQLLLHTGQDQFTGMKDSHVLLASAKIAEEWPQETGIFDLSTFLGMLSQFKQPDIQFQSNMMVVSSGGVRVNYRYADPSLIKVPKVKTLPTDNPGIEFVLNKQLFDSIIKQCLTLKLPYIIMDVASGKVALKGADSKNPLAHGVEFQVPEADVQLHDESIKLVYPFEVDHLTKLLDGGYKVALSSKWKAYAHFTHLTEPISYFSAAQINPNRK